MFKYLNTIGTAEGDTPETRLKKFTLILITLSCFIAAPIWGLSYYLLGFRNASLVPFAYMLLLAPAMIHFAIKKNEKVLLNIQLFGIFICPLVMQILAGGLFNAGAIILWSFLAPLTALIFYDLRKARIWMALVIVSIVLLIAFNDYSETFGDNITKSQKIYLAGMNLIGATLVIYFAIRYFVKTIDKNRRLLQEEKKQTDDLREQVIEKKASEEMRKQFETMANSIPNLAWMGDADGWVFWYNNRWFEYTGTTHEEMEGWGWKLVHDPEILPSVVEQWELSLRTGEPFEMVFPLKGADNIFRPFLSRAIPIRNNSGEVIRWFGTCTDISKQKELERMKDDFLSGVSHELKTPVTSLKAYVQLVDRALTKNEDHQTLSMVKRMGSQVDRLTGLIEELLIVTRIQKGKLAFNESTFDINKLVKEISEDMQTTSPTIPIGLSLLSNEVMVSGDRNKIGQVLINLLSNAIKFSNRKPIQVRSAILENGVEVCVQDFGIGIPAPDTRHVFEQFYQVNSHITFPGLGVGLYISSEIMKMHKGKILVESTLGEGSSFSIWLPLDPQALKLEGIASSFDL